MYFLVKLISVSETKNQQARDDLASNATHVANDFWLFEGDEAYLDPGIDFDIIGTARIEAFGGLSSFELKLMVQKEFNVDKCFLQ